MSLPRNPGWRWILLLLPPLLLAGLALRLPTLRVHPFQDEATAVLMAGILGESGSIHPPETNWPPLAHFLLLGALKGLHLLGLGPSLGEALVEAAAEGFAGAPYLLRLGRVLAGLYGVLAVGLVCLLGRRLLGRQGPALWAAAWMAVAPLHLVVSRLATTDALVTLLTTAALWLAAEGEARGRRWLAAAGVAAGLAAGAKYTGGLAVLAPLGVLWLSGREPGVAARLRWTVWVGLAALAGMVLAMPGIVLDPARYLAWLGRHAADAGQGWEFFRGHPRGWLYHPQVSCRWFLGSLGAGLMAAVGWGSLMGRKRAAMAVLLPFGAAWFLIIGWSAVLYGRYWAPFLPLLCLGVAWAGTEWARRLPWLGHGLLALGAGWALFLGVSHGLALRQPDTRAECAQWIRARVPMGAKVATLYPLRAEPEATALVLRELRARGTTGERLQFLQWIVARDGRQLAHLLWDTAYPALEPPFVKLEHVSVKDGGVTADVAELRRRGVRWYLWSSFRDGLVEDLPSAFPARAAFLRELKALCPEPAARFDPGPPDPRIPLAELETHQIQAFPGKRPGPELRLYELPP